MTTSRTYAKMQVTTPAFEEIKAKLVEAGYDQALLDEGNALDMHGIALVAIEVPIPGKQIGTIGKDEEV